MANVKTDLPKIGIDKSNREIQVLCPSGHHERVDGSSATATSSETFYTDQVVQIFPLDTRAYMKIGTDDATTDDIPIAPDLPYFITIKADTKLTFISAVVDLTVML